MEQEHRMARSAMHPPPNSPLVVAYGLGVNSTAMLVEFAARKIRPDLILFADTGGEKPETYAYLRVIRPFLKGDDMPLFQIAPPGQPQRHSPSPTLFSLPLLGDCE
jgi:3'-phosphoadenosine 5'-phosphosulfate sulfotransferase (PAPS reductase)/FAD synthetase